MAEMACLQSICVPGPRTSWTVKLSNDLALEPDLARQEDGDFNSVAPNMLQEHVVKGRSALCGHFLFLSDDL
jgi:hypothetical protein